MAKIYTIASTIDGELSSWHGLHTSLEAAKAAVRESFLEAFGEEEAPKFDSLEWDDLSFEDRERYMLHTDEGIRYEIVSHELV